jgi:hypothetical protein
LLEGKIKDMSSANRFCDRCGTAVPSLDSEFCVSCGSPLSAVRDEPAEEPVPKESISHRASPEPSPSREDVADGGRKRAPFGRIILAVVSFLLGPIGMIIGLWYMLKRKEKGFGGLLLSLGLVSLLMLILTPSDDASDSDNSIPIEIAAPTKVASAEKASPTSTPTAAPIIFSDEQASAFLLKPDDFPKNWKAKKNGLILDAKNDYLTDYNVQMIKITLETHEDESAAQAAFSAKKAETQTTIDGRGISGDKLENVSKYPLFVWNASSQANISGVEKWTVIGVYGNITVKVYNEGSVGAPKKGFTVDFAKKQIDRIKGD